MLLFTIAGFALAIPHELQDTQKPAGLTDEINNFIKGPTPLSVFPTALSQQSAVAKLIAAIDEALVRKHLVTLTEFPDRYYQSDNGVLAAKWLSDQVVALNATASSEVLLTVKYFNHAKWKQPSVIARLEARQTIGKPSDVVIIGTHFDSLGKGSGRPEPNPNPAADDCASGSSVIAEALRVLVSQQFVPKRPLEVHWYAAEEVGILGSNEIAKDYAQRGVQVLSYLNLDQVGYVKPGSTPTIGIMTDFVTKPATNLLRLVAKAYTTITLIVDTQCGYRCTDNSAWFDSGYNSALAFESSMKNAFPFNDRVNSDGSPLDTVNIIDFPHVLEFAKNTIGFVVELLQAS